MSDEKKPLSGNEVLAEAKARRLENLNQEFKMYTDKLEEVRSDIDRLKKHIGYVGKQREMIKGRCKLLRPTFEFETDPSFPEIQEFVLDVQLWQSENDLKERLKTYNAQEKMISKEIENIKTDLDAVAVE
jgi:chaperonin cofactor prefoldin